MMQAIARCCAVMIVVGGSMPADAQPLPRDRPTVASIRLPFAATRIAMSADGERAAVWDTPTNQTNFQSLAVVDLRSGKLVAQTILQSTLLDVVIGKEIYVADDKGISRLSADRLEPQATFANAGGPRPLPNSRQPPPLMLVANHRLSVGPRTRLTLPDLTLIENYDHDINTAEGWLDGRSGFGWLSEGVLWDDSMSMPLLLVWPYEFQRVPFSYSSREPNEFQPRTGTWYPFPTKLSSRPDRKVIASAVSPDIAATLGVVQDASGHHLASFRLDNGKFIASIQLAANNAEPNRPRPVSAAIATGDEQFAVLLLGELHTGALKDLRGDGSLPFHVLPRQSTFVLAMDKPTTVRYQATGATRFRISSRILGSEGKPFEATSETGEFTLAVSDALDALLSNAAGLAANLNQGRDIDDNHRRAEFYAGPSRSAFRNLFGREANGLPLPIDIQLTAEGVDFATAILRHDFLVEVPLPQFEEALDRKYPHARSPWKKPIQEFDLTNYPASAVPPAGRGAWFDYLRELWTQQHPGVRGVALRDAAHNAKEVGDKRLHDRYVKWIADNQWRTWTDVDDRRAEALLVQYFAGQVTLRTRQGVEFTFDETKLSDADRAFLQGMTEPVTPNGSDAWREFVFAESVRAVNQFHNVRQAFPPPSLTDDTGQPRLSWRVLLLRELGYDELFALFHFDEPWNSEHNLALIPFMPNAFAVDAAAPEVGKTTCLTVSSPLSAMPTSGMSSMRGFGTEASATVIFVEAAAARAVEWTKPRDLGLYEFTDPSVVVRSRHGKVLVGLLSGRTLRIPDDTSSDDWRFAVNRGDQRRVFETLAP